MTHDGPSASALIESLGLQAHPEGGWYRETWRAEAADGERAAGTSILFLLEDGQGSHWHQVDAEEHWFWHGGAPVELSVADDAGEHSVIRLGMDIGAGQSPQGRVPTGYWQAAKPVGGWALVSCVVIPGFRFSGFTLAPEGWEPGF